MFGIVNYGIFIVSGILFIFARTVTRKLRNNNRISLIMNRLTGVLFIGLGLTLVKAKASS